jgi:hypothetical protein
MQGKKCEVERALREQAAALAHGKSQDAGRKENNAQKAI